VQVGTAVVHIESTVERKGDVAVAMAELEHSLRAAFPSRLVTRKSLIACLVWPLFRHCKFAFSYSVEGECEVARGNMRQHPAARVKVKAYEYKKDR